MSERIDWLNGTPIDAILAYLEWREAVEKADVGDSAPLVSLLRSDHVLGPEARNLVADLFKRKKLTNRKGRQATPAYRRTLREAEGNNAEKLVAYFERKGEKRDDAIRSALRDLKRDELRDDNDLMADVYPDEEIDGMITDEQFDWLENRLKRGKRA